MYAILHISQHREKKTMRKDDYRSLTETLYLSSVPGMKEKLLDGKNTPVSDCVPESEVAW